jgi:signal transduction histidine kinase
MTRDWRDWAPDLAVGVAVLLVGLFEAATTDVVSSSRSSLALVSLGMAVAAGLSRRAPGVGLVLVWGTCGFQLLYGTDLMVVQLALVAVAFGTARWGSLATVWLSALSIPAAGLVVFVLLAVDQLSGVVSQVGLMTFAEDAYQYADRWQVAAGVIGTSVLAVPWLAGLALRFMSRARRSEVSQVAAEQDAALAHRESQQAREIARLREEQTRMARDVHDVVGHSLAVILAQAESAQFRKDSDTRALKETMATIASSARSSLQDVRQVLTTTRESTVRHGGLDDLVDGVRASGHQVVSTEEGVVQPLPPELETVAYRVLQEMLTNAIRHGRRDGVVRVERHWQGELRIEVRNVVDTSVEETSPIAAVSLEDGAPSAGHGLDGMRRRLEAAGGRLDVRRRQEEGGATFTATAWLPLRSRTA